MTNLRPPSDHNICGSSCAASAAPAKVDLSARRRSESGYTLVALLALMTVVALFAMAVAPRMQQQVQRQREQEAIYRGEQVAYAIGQYFIYRVSVTGNFGDQSLPASMDQLKQGIPLPGGAKYRQILRVSASRDPLTIEGDWRFIHPRSQALLEFQQSILFYTESLVPQPTAPELVRLQQVAVPQLGPVINTGTPREKKEPSSFDDDVSGPFVGVVSRSKKDSVLTYYGIERHDQWIFTPLFRQ
jgi:hypothetical protein